ncbi:hypothetical protein ACJMK2_028447 [Sinanodonta woodiana]|uniref:RING-type domain-containing protein n=1 Tax=Sinanodonta woodiana TaxID=1069815 RepID=A0ABD3X762_SINWO
MLLIVILCLQDLDFMVRALEDPHGTIAGHHCRQTDLRIGYYAHWRKQNNSEIEKNGSTIGSVLYDPDESISKYTMLYGQDTHSERQQTFYSEQVDLELLGSEDYGGVVLDKVMVSVLFLCWIIHINYAVNKLLQFAFTSMEERRIHGNMAVTVQRSVSMGSEVEGFRAQQETVEVTTKKPAEYKAEVNDLRVNVDTLKVTLWSSEITEVIDLLGKSRALDIADETSGSKQVKDFGVNMGSWQQTAQTSVLIDIDNSRVKGGTENFNSMSSNITIEEDHTGNLEIIKIIYKSNERAEAYQLRSIEENWKSIIKTSSQEEVEIDRAVCKVHINEKELESCDDRVHSNELFKEQGFGDGVKIDLIQSIFHDTCKSVGHKNEDSEHDLSYYYDIHQEKKQHTISGKISEFLKEKKKHSLRIKGSDVSNRTVTSTTSQEWLKKYPHSDISISFRDTGLSEEKEKTATCFYKYRTFLKSQPSASGVKQAVTPVASTEESLLLVIDEPSDASSQKCKGKEIYDKNSDSCLIFTERPSDFISLYSEKKKTRKALFSKLQCIILDNPLSEETCFNKDKGSAGIEMHILSDMDLTMQQKKCGVDIYEITGADIDLQEKKKHHLRQIVWFPMNSLPVPRLSRDAIVGLVEEQTRDGHKGCTLSPSEKEDLREMLRLLASDNVPGPQITMKYEMLRLCTMKTFPGWERPFAIRIVGAGFYYAGHQDQVICYCCGNRKDSWVIGDIPLLIHQNMASDCGFLTHNSQVNVPIRKANSSESPSPAEVRLLAVQRFYGSNQSDTAQSESSLMLPSCEQNRQHSVSDNLPTVSAHVDSVLEPPPKYPQYAVKNMRINSFQGWPAELQQRPEEMAECGFYYAGFNDCVRCFFCGVGLRHWMNEDDPWIEHARWSTSCVYVLKMKGEEFVSLIKMAVEIAERAAPRSNSEGSQALELASSNSNTADSIAVEDASASTGVAVGNATGAAASTPSPGNTEIQKYLLTDAAQSVLDMGYQPKLVQRAIEKVLLKIGAEDLTGHIIMEAVFEIEEENKKQPEGQASTQSVEINESHSKGAEATEEESSEESQLDLEKIRREHRELRDATLCKICMENTISVVFLPCGHLVTCPDCAPAMRKCPICRTLIKGTVKTFYG